MYQPKSVAAHMIGGPLDGRTLVVSENPFYVVIHDRPTASNWRMGRACYLMSTFSDGSPVPYDLTGVVEYVFQEDSVRWEGESVQEMS